MDILGDCDGFVLSMLYRSSCSVGCGYYYIQKNLLLSVLLDYKKWLKNISQYMVNRCQIQLLKEVLSWKQIEGLKDRI